jgi:histidyl-tRNA synthetase
MTSDSSRVEPRTLKGFRDFLPQQMMPREELMATARRVYRSYGFAPIDTPALEYIEVLLGKGGEESEKQMYRFQDHGGREVGMRFDLTVPLARFAAQHHYELGMPFKRYHIGTVWRGENVQRGRYREFMQCDFDTIGTTSIVADIETALVIHDLMRAIGFEKFSIRINNRMVLTGLLAKLGLGEKATPVLRALDKFRKSTRDAVAAEIVEQAGASSASADEVLKLAEMSGSNDMILDQLPALVEGNEVGEQGVAKLRDVIEGCRAAGVSDERLQLDVSIARGLDYYTGTIYETFLGDLPNIGSVASGGRYDNLAGLFTKEKLPGIGASLGLDRLLAAMDEMSMLPAAKTPAQVLIVYFEEVRRNDYLHLAATLRAEGIAVELYPEPKKVGQQLKYADGRGFRLALIAGTREFDHGMVQLKDLATGQQQEVAIDERGSQLVVAITKALSSTPR